jgi:ferrochelatase
MDKYVMMFRFVASFIVRGIILQTRPKIGCCLRKIWWDEGSPLVVISRKDTEK